jgi:hypothetical protein
MACFFVQNGAGACTVYVEAAVTSVTNQTICSLVAHLQHAPHFPERLPELIANANVLQHQLVPCIPHAITSLTQRRV